jgi:hypothetical protein
VLTGPGPDRFSRRRGSSFAAAPCPGRWNPVATTSGRKEPRTYDPDEIDQFFVIDGDHNYYLIPIRVVGGLSAIQVSAYQSDVLPRLVPQRPTGAPPLVD